MKKNNLAEIKKMTVKEIAEMVKKTQGELVDLQIQKNIGKLKNLREPKAKRKDLAQMFTVIKQKQLLEKLEKVNG